MLVKTPKDSGLVPAKAIQPEPYGARRYCTVMVMAVFCDRLPEAPVTVTV
jgi:hypothetical protein